MITHRSLLKLFACSLLVYSVTAPGGSSNNPPVDRSRVRYFDRGAEIVIPTDVYLHAAPGAFSNRQVSYVPSDRNIPYQPTELVAEGDVIRHMTDSYVRLGITAEDAENRARRELEHKYGTLRVNYAMNVHKPDRLADGTDNSHSGVGLQRHEVDGQRFLPTTGPGSQELSRDKELKLAHLEQGLPSPDTGYHTGGVRGNTMRR